MALWTEGDDKAAKAEKPVREPAKADPAPAPAPVQADTDGDGVSDVREALIEEYQHYPENYQHAAAGEKVEFVSELEYVWTGGTLEQPAEDTPASE